MVCIVQTMGNLWTTTKIQPVYGTYLEDRPRRPMHSHQRVASFIPAIQPLRVVRDTPVPYKDKAKRIFHELAVRREAFNGRVVGSNTTL
jgi:hypothetical protein